MKEKIIFKPLEFMDFKDKRMVSLLLLFNESKYFEIDKKKSRKELKYIFDTIIESILKKYLEGKLSDNDFVEMIENYIDNSIDLRDIIGEETEDKLLNFIEINKEILLNEDDNPDKWLIEYQFYDGDEFSPHNVLTSFSYDLFSDVVYKLLNHNDRERYIKETIYNFFKRGGLFEINNKQNKSIEVISILNENIPDYVNIKNKYTLIKFLTGKEKFNLFLLNEDILDNIFKL